MSEIPRAGGICIAVLVGAIISAILFGESFSIVEPTQWGIVYNKNTQHVETKKIYSEGRYLIGLGKTFITFPRTIENIYFSPWSSDGGRVAARSFDGMKVEIDLAFQYKIKPNVQDIVRLYYDFGTDFHAAYVRFARATVRNVASNWTAFQYFDSRAQIAEQMHSALQSKLTTVYADVIGFQLINLEFDPQLESAIEDTQVAIQDIEEAKFEQNVAQIQADSSVAVAQEEAVVLLSKANATGRTRIAEATAQANILIDRTTKQATSLAEVRSRLGLDNSTSLLSYLWLTMINENESPSVTFNMKHPHFLQALK